ncbi:hypothetical protein B0T17DRAFT_501992 [Bombardia bombarda]|uniref:Uncharacterized protein n=1 Tax=Bombardia bombarda TaxID=252184 RepID=A0AA39XIK0_9PEZI|nr:hypothetical protein B0T17DRAFT_501992 [Bombardia bombarda]
MWLGFNLGCLLGSVCCAAGVARRRRGGGSDTTSIGKVPALAGSKDSSMIEAQDIQEGPGHHKDNAFVGSGAMEGATLLVVLLQSNTAFASNKLPSLRARAAGAIQYQQILLDASSGVEDSHTKVPDRRKVVPQLATWSLGDLSGTARTWVQSAVAGYRKAACQTAEIRRRYWCPIRRRGPGVVRSRLDPVQKHGRNHTIPVILQYLCRSDAIGQPNTVAGCG